MSHELVSRKELEDLVDCLESRVSENDRPPYSRVAHEYLKVTHSYRPLYSK